MTMLRGPVDWGLRRDREGVRDYFIDWKIQADSWSEGPVCIENCPGLPLPGSVWQFPNTTWALPREQNLNVYCTPELEVSRISKSNEKEILWRARQIFSDRRQGQQQNTSSNPLLEPAKWSGSFVKRTKSATDLYVETIRMDQFGLQEPVLRPVEMQNPPSEAIPGPPAQFFYLGPMTTSWEPITGKSTEFDCGGPTVEVEINILNLPLTAFVIAYNTVNIDWMWGLPPRTIKLTNVNWSRRTYTSNTTFFYVVRYEFEVDWRTWDKVELNRGKKCLRGHSPGSKFKKEPMNPLWPDWEVVHPILGPGGYPNWLNPRNYEHYKDDQGENTATPVLLNEYGIPVEEHFGINVYQKMIYYFPSDFIAMGIPPVIPTGTI